MDQPPTFLIGLSGPTSAGKTTLAHLLTRVFTPHISRILHGDDFCKELDQIPTSHGYLDADGPAGVDFARMREVLDYVNEHGGKTPEGFVSWQADVFPRQDERALNLAGEELLVEMREKVEESGVLGGLDSGQEAREMVVVEGFMLFNVPEIRERRRRLTRPNYGAEAKEGEFWKTEDYFEKMVWRNYVEQHGQFFEGGNVEGEVTSERCKELGIVVQEGMDVEVRATLRWAVGAILEALKGGWCKERRVRHTASLDLN